MPDTELAKRLRDAQQNIAGGLYEDNAQLINLLEEAAASLSAARAAERGLREALKIIADWDQAPITGEYRESLLDIIRSITDCARRALAAGQGGENG